MKTSKQIGDLGESLALEFLIKHNYNILTTNYRYLKSEIDIIAIKDDILHIIEVKYRSGNLVEAEKSVNHKKQKLLVQGANGYIEQHNIDIEVCFDVIIILQKGARHIIDHIKNAFEVRLS